MNSFRSASKRRRGSSGFNLVEVTLALGILSVGLVSLAPMMAVGLNAAHLARAERQSSQIAQVLVESARQGTLSAGTAYFDLEGNVCAVDRAIFTAESAFTPVPENTLLSRLKITVTPVKASGGAKTYVVVLAPSS